MRTCTLAAMAAGLTLAALSFVALAQEAPAGAPADDVDALLAAIWATHPDPLNATDQATWDRVADEVRAAAPGASPARRYMDMLRLMALLKDGHSLAMPPRDADYFAHSLPIVVRRFVDGFWIVAAAPEWESALGRRIDAIDGRPMDECLDTLLPFLPGDNRQFQTDFASWMFALPAMLHAVGIAQSPDDVRLTLSDPNGASGELTLPAIDSLPAAMTGPPDGWKLVTTGRAPMLMERDKEVPYWFEALEGGTLYIRHREIANNEDWPFDVFCREAFEAATAQGADRVVIDVRENGGGNNTLTFWLIHEAARSEFNTPGRLFVLIDGGVFSAAQNLVTTMEQRTWATFVGEPTAGRPNHYGDAEWTKLPNGGVNARISTLFWQDSSPQDAREWVSPNIAAPMTFADFAAGRDVTLEAALTASEKDLWSVKGVWPNRRFRHPIQRKPWPPKP